MYAIAFLLAITLEAQVIISSSYRFLFIISSPGFSLTSASKREAWKTSLQWNHLSIGSMIMTSSISKNRNRDKNDEAVHLVKRKLVMQVDF